MRTALAIARRDFGRWFTNPTGYIFITLFIILCAAGQLLFERFFLENLANLNSLNQFFPYILVFFAPAMAMGTWADERRHGTDELLLTLPSSDLSLVVGKYLGALAVYGVALLFTLTLVVCLLFLGRPDLGLMAGTYLGYAMLGAALIAIAMIGSLLVESVTVGFILGAIFCAIFVALGDAPFLVGDTVASFGVRRAFAEFTSGVVSLEGVVYFVGLTAAGLAVNHAYLRLRRLRVGKAHPPVRVACLVAGVVCLSILSDRSAARLDVTAERLHSLSPLTVQAIQAVTAERPVFIQAYVSKEVPQHYVETRENLLTLLREMDARGRGRVHVRITETTKATEAAREAEDRFKIRPVRLPAQEGASTGRLDVFLGAAVTGGLDEVVIPFFYRGISPEYELTRSLRVVSRAKRGRVGILATDAKWFGGFDFQTMQSSPPWEIVEELKRQYEVVSVPVDAPITEQVDVLIAPMPSSLPQAQLDHLQAYATQGKAVLLIDDPLPIINPSIGANEQKQNRRGMMMGGSPPEPKGNFREFYRLLGIQWDPLDIVWDTYKPHPTLGEMPEEVVFVGKGNGAREPFSKKSPVSSKLQEMVFLFAGSLKGGEAKGIEVTPLLTAGKASGILSYNEVWRSNPFFGGGGLNPARRHVPSAALEGPILAARFQGKEGEVSVDAIFIADLDLISEQFFDLRRRGLEHLTFDNVTFVLNAVDALMRDEETIELRTRRPRHRTLEVFEELRRDYDRKALEGARAAEAEAEKLLNGAQGRYDEAVKKIESRTDLDERTKNIMADTVREAEQRKLDVEKRRIESDKEASVAKSEAERDGKVLAIQRTIRWMALGGASLPAIIAALIAFYLGIRRQMEVRR
jgi:ABC-2 type transport system permease protein